VGRRPRPSRSQRVFAEALGSQPSPGGGWTANRHEQVRHFRGWAYIAIRANALMLAKTPPVVGTPAKQAGKKSLRKSHTPDIDPFDDEHPLCRLLANPNEPEVGFNLWYDTEVSMGLTGSAYWWLPRNAVGLPAEAWVIPSPWVTAIYDESGAWVARYEVRTYRTGQVITIPADEIIHFRDPHPYDKRDGYAALQAGSPWVDTEEAIDRSRLSSFKNGARPGLTVELGEKYSEPDDAELQRIHAKFLARYSGEHNDGRPIITPPGAKVGTAAWSPTEMAYIDSDNQIRDKVLALYGVPYPVAMIVGGATFENSSEAVAQYYRQTLCPKRAYYAQVLTEKLARLYDERAMAYWPDDTPETSADKTARLEQGLKHGGLTRNEWRSEYGLEPLPDADDLLVPAGLVPIADAGLPPEGDMVDGPAGGLGGGADAGDDDPGEDAHPWGLPLKALGGLYFKGPADNYREEQHPRDDHGRWGSGGGGAKPEGKPGGVRTTRRRALERAPDMSAAEHDMARRAAQLAAKPHNTPEEAAEFKTLRGKLYEATKQRLKPYLDAAAKDPPHDNMASAAVAMMQAKMGEYVADGKGRLGFVRASMQTVNGQLQSVPSVQWLDNDEWVDAKDLYASEALKDIRLLGVSPTAPKKKTKAYDGGLGLWSRRSELVNGHTNGNGHQ
jgi:HK97 family phage portal protein